MRVYVQVVDTRNGIFQAGMIEEKVAIGYEMDNAIKHFGIIYGEVDWKFTQKNDISLVKYGEVTGTSKVVNVITLL
jgi:hypothetical protein